MKKLIALIPFLLFAGGADALTYVAPTSSARWTISGSGIQATIEGGTLAVTNTGYIMATSLSPTGLGSWINCTNAKKVIFEFKMCLDTDTATPLGTGTFYIDASILPTTALTNVSTWNTTIGGVQYQTSSGSVITVPDPPTSLRFKMAGIMMYTGAVGYKIIY